MNKTTSYLMAGALVLSSSAVMAEDTPHEFSANVAIGTDYLFRGISQTNGNPAISGGFDYTYSGFAVDVYAGTWASNVEFGDDSTMEIDFYGGFTSEFSNGIAWDAGLLYYHYPASDASDIDYFEAYGSLGYAFSDVTLEPEIGVTLSYSPDWTLTPGRDADAWYVNPTLDLSLPWGIGMGFGYGYQDVDGIGDYQTASVSFTKDWSIFSFDLTYSSTFDNDDFCSGIDLCDNTVTFTASSSF